MGINCLILTGIVKQVCVSVGVRVHACVCVCRERWRIISSQIHLFSHEIFLGSLKRPIVQSCRAGLNDYISQTASLHPHVTFSNQVNRITDIRKVRRTVEACLSSEV